VLTAYDSGKVCKLGEVIFVCAVKAYRGGRGTSPFILNLSIRWKSLNTALPSGEEPWYQLNGGLLAPTIIWMSWRREKSLAPARIQTPDHVDHIIV